MLYKKSDHVFWAQTNTGMLLQNIQDNTFLELDKVQEKIWEYLDGTFNQEQIVSILKNFFPKSPQYDLQNRVSETIATFNEYGLICENNSKHEYQQK